MKTFRIAFFSVTALLVAMLSVSILPAGADHGFEWTTDSAEAKKLLAEVQARIENFQFGSDTLAQAQKVVEADPEFAMGEYYLSAVMPPPDNQAHLDRAVELSMSASDGERRFIDAMVVVRANNGANFQDGIPLLEKLAADYPNERLVYVILGQLYQGAAESEKARVAFEKAQAIGPKSNRIRSFLANDDLLKGHYSQARATFKEIEKDLPKGSVPFSVRYGVAFSHLYEGKVDSALESLEKYLTEYTESGASQTFPEVFIWNSIARINLEHGRLTAALKAYEEGYRSVPKSSLPEDQKQLWLGRLHHGKCRVLSKMGKHQAAWAEAETIRKMIDDGGEEARQYLPAYHYLLGYLKLESGEYQVALEHLQKGDLTDPFQKLLLARSYERLGDKEKAKTAYQEILESTSNGLERALAYPEAKRRLSML